MDLKLLQFLWKHWDQSPILFMWESLEANILDTYVVQMNVYILEGVIVIILKTLKM